MNQINAEQIIQQDIDKIYLGNLNTVEFDLTLPSSGVNGTEITWKSDNNNFLKPNGKVTRPFNGIGDRKVLLTGYFRYQGVEKKKVYEVHILEEPNMIQMTSAFPLMRNVRRGEHFEFPSSVVTKAIDGKYYTRRVEWEGGNSETFEECGIYHKKGRIEKESIEADLVISVTDECEEKIENRRHQTEALENGETKLLPGSVFYEHRERAIAYFKHADLNQLLYNFRAAAGLDTLGAPEMTGWDSPKCMLRGHTTGHFMSALALCWRETKDEEILEKLEYMVHSLGLCQEAFESQEAYHSGYLGGYSEEQFDLLEEGESYPNIWAPYYTLHKILAGLLDCWQYAGSEEALDIAKKAGLWTYDRLSRLNKSRREAMWATYIAGEFGGMNESMAVLYQITNDRRYLECARMFDNDHLLVPMEEKRDVLGGIHANQHIPQIVGCMQLYEATKERRYYEIAEYFWHIVTEHHIYANGGTGENEMFYGPDDIGKRLTQDTAELCASYNMLKLTRQLYRFRPLASYMDYYERAMFNHVAAAFDDETTGESTYFYPLIPSAVRQFRFENSCCHGTGMESQVKYTESIYWKSEDALYINLFLNSSAVWREKGLTVTQQVEETAPGIIRLKIEGKGGAVLKIRRPYWCEGMYSILVNNVNYLAKCDADGYINIKKYWSDDEVQVEFPCAVRAERTKDRKEMAALAYGPYILAAVSGSKEYLELRAQDAAKAEVTSMTENGQRRLFVNIRTDELKDILWIPLNRIKKQKHHVYWKLKK